MELTEHHCAVVTRTHASPMDFFAVANAVIDLTVELDRRTTLGRDDLTRNVARDLFAVVRDERRKNSMSSASFSERCLDLEVKLAEVGVIVVEALQEFVEPHEHLLNFVGGHLELVVDDLVAPLLCLQDRTLFV
jgi:hypothetical protein